MSTRSRQRRPETLAEAAAGLEPHPPVPVHERGPRFCRLCATREDEPTARRCAVCGLALSTPPRAPPKSTRKPKRPATKSERRRERRRKRVPEDPTPGLWRTLMGHALFVALFPLLGPVVLYQLVRQPQATSKNATRARALGLGALAWTAFVALFAARS